MNNLNEKIVKYVSKMIGSTKITKSEMEEAFYLYFELTGRYIADKNCDICFRQVFKYLIKNTKH
jgi:hypothetical protein